MKQLTSRGSEKGKFPKPSQDQVSKDNMDKEGVKRWREWTDEEERVENSNGVRRMRMMRMER